MPKRKLLSFVIPVKDEDKTIAVLAKQIFSVVTGMGSGFKAEIIFIHFDLPVI